MDAQTQFGENQRMPAAFDVNGSCIDGGMQGKKEEKSGICEQEDGSSQC